MTPEQREQLQTLMLEMVPNDGSNIGNKTLRETFTEKANPKVDFELNDDHYWEIRNELISDGKLAKGRGKGGSVYSTVEQPDGDGEPPAAAPEPREADLYDPFYNTCLLYTSPSPRDRG